MIKKTIAVSIAALTCAFCALSLTACSARPLYTLKTDGEGNKYYVFSCANASSLTGEYEISAYYGEGEDYAPVTTIAAQGLAGTRLTKIILPATLTEIGTAAFSYSYSLQEVVFAEGANITKIPQGAFAYCESLREITLPEGVVSVGYMSFYSCKNLESVTLPDSLVTIYAEAFENCASLSVITLPQSLTTIGELAFYKSGLKEIVIPDGVRDIQKTVTDEQGDSVEQTVFGIGYGAFHSCESLERAVVGAGVTVLRSGTFGYCPALKEIHLPAGLEEVEGAFYSEGEFIYGHAFHNDSSLADVYFAGSSEQWEALKKNIDNQPFSAQGATYDNSALLNAAVHFGV